MLELVFKTDKQRMVVAFYYKIARASSKEVFTAGPFTC